MLSQKDLAFTSIKLQEQVTEQHVHCGPCVLKIQHIFVAHLCTKKPQISFRMTHTRQLIVVTSEKGAEFSSNVVRGEFVI